MVHRLLSICQLFIRYALLRSLHHVQKIMCTWKNMPIHSHVLIQDPMDRLDKRWFENDGMEGYPTPVLLTVPSSHCNAVLCGKTCQCWHICSTHCQDILVHVLTYLLTPWSRVLLEKLVKIFLTFYKTRTFITIFTSARHLSLSWAKVSVQVQGFLCEHFITRYGFTVRSCYHLAQSQSWRATSCWLSTTTYSIYSQLPFTFEAVPPSATSGHVMSWWQGPTYHGIYTCYHGIYTCYHEDWNSRFSQNSGTFLLTKKFSESKERTM